MDQTFMFRQTREAISRVQTLALSNIAQSVFMPHFHPVGFEKVAIPREMYSRILTGRKKALREKKYESKCKHDSQISGLLQILTYSHCHIGGS